MIFVLKVMVFIPHTTPLSSADRGLCSSVLCCLHHLPSTFCPTGAVPDPHKTVGQHHVFPSALGVWSDRPREKPQKCIANQGYVGVTQQMYRCVYVQVI